jgi:hypothetical protein
MKKINHVERIKAEGKDREFYFELVERAAGAKEAEKMFEACAAKLEALGVSEHDAAEILLDYGQAMQENGFNAGFGLGTAPCWPLTGRPVDASRRLRSIGAAISFEKIFSRW